MEGAVRKKLAQDSFPSFGLSVAEKKIPNLSWTIRLAVAFTPFNIKPVRVTREFINAFITFDK